jgi:hypothetical protein
MVRFHRDLHERAKRDPNFHYHYVTARELAKLVVSSQSPAKSGEIAEILNDQSAPI